MKEQTPGLPLQALSTKRPGLRWGFKEGDTFHKKTNTVQFWKLNEVLREGKFIETEHRMMVARGQGQWGKGTGPGGRGEAGGGGSRHTPSPFQ